MTSYQRVVLVMACSVRSWVVGVAWLNTSGRAMSRSERVEGTSVFDVLAVVRRELRGLRSVAGVCVVLEAGPGADGLAAWLQTEDVPVFLACPEDMLRTARLRRSDLWDVEIAALMALGGELPLNAWQADAKEHEGVAARQREARQPVA